MLERIATRTSTRSNLAGPFHHAGIQARPASNVDLNQARNVAFGERASEVAGERSPVGDSIQSALVIGPAVRPVDRLELRGWNLEDCCHSFDVLARLGDTEDIAVVEDDRFWLNRLHKYDDTGLDVRRPELDLRLQQRQGAARNIASPSLDRSLMPKRLQGIDPCRSPRRM